uniref:RNA polymerase alpha subunit n=1 Tax=Panagrolaimus sp. JU765 TaxID=591449 RepID=A0AC34QCI9_9BILA
MEFKSNNYNVEKIVKLKSEIELMKMLTQIQVLKIFELSPYSHGFIEHFIHGPDVSKVEDVHICHVTNTVTVKQLEPLFMRFKSCQKLYIERSFISGKASSLLEKMRFCQSIRFDFISGFEFDDDSITLPKINGKRHELITNLKLTTIEEQSNEFYELCGIFEDEKSGNFIKLLITDLVQ